MTTNEKAVTRAFDRYVDVLVQNFRQKSVAEVLGSTVFYKLPTIWGWSIEVKRTISSKAPGEKGIAVSDHGYNDFIAYIQPNSNVSLDNNNPNSLKGIGLILQKKQQNADK
jgi:hypothetical protein